MIRARLAGVTLAESDHTEIVEGNHYFPPSSLKLTHFKQTRSHSLCPWKGIASYYSVTVDDHLYKNAAWTYRHPSPLARRIKNHVAFWPFVEIEIDEPDSPDGKERT